MLFWSHKCEENYKYYLVYFTIIHLKYRWTRPYQLRNTCKCAKHSRTKAFMLLLLIAKYRTEQLFFEGTKHSFIHSFDRKSGKKNKYIYFSWNFGQIRIYNDQHLLCWFGLWGPLSSPFQRKTHWCDFNF